MRHSVVSLVLLFGIGLASTLTLVGGGEINYGSGNSGILLHDGAPDESAAKGSAAAAETPPQNAVKNRETALCKNLEASACPRPAADISQ